MLRRNSKHRRGVPDYRALQTTAIDRKRMELRNEARTQLALATTADRCGDAEAAEQHRKNAQDLEARAAGTDPFGAANDN